MIEPHTTALLLAAHGERREGAENAAAARLAEALRARGLVREVGAGFIKGRPSIGEAISLLSAPRIAVYPLLMADGYFTRFRLAGILDAARRQDRARAFHVLPPLGLDRALAELVVEQALATAGDYGFAPAKTSLVLLAHGSKHGSASRLAAERLARSARILRSFKDIAVALLEQPPTLAEAVSALGSPVVVVGLFAGEGMHAAGDAPRLLAALRCDDVVFAGPIGTCDRIADLIAGALGRATRKLSRTARHHLPGAGARHADLHGTNPAAYGARC